MWSFVRQVFVFLLHPCLPNSVVKWVAEIEFGLGRAGGRENAFTHAGGVDGFTYLYSSITAEPKIMLSTIRDRNIAMTIKATSAIIPRIEEMNSNFLQPSALLINH